jgi:trimeric autotransporter adhesin
VKGDFLKYICSIDAGEQPAFPYILRGGKPMKKRRLIIFILATLVVIALILLSSAVAASVSISTRSCTSYFQVYNGTSWHDYLTPQHYITNSSPEQVAYCMQQTKASPSGTSYSTSDVLGGYSARTSTGLQIILENGYPFTTPSGLSAAEARYATANAIRFWLAEEGDDYQYNYDNFSAYTDAQLRTYTAAGKIGSKVRTVSSSYNDILQFSIELLIAARSQMVPPHTISFSPSNLNLTLSNGYFTGTTTVTLANMEGGYTLNSSALPSGSSVSGFTGNSGDVLTIKIPMSVSNSNMTISISAIGYDDRTRTNIFVYAPSSSSYQKMLTATVGDSYMENVGNASLSVKTPAMADLIVSSLTTDHSSYDAGDTVTVTATVKNQGTTAASSFSVQLAPGTLAKQTVNITSLAVGSSQNVTFTFTAPIYTTDTAMTLTVIADSADTVDELDESNNSRATSITVLAAKPDLDITALSTDKSIYGAGQTVTVTATVKNIGLVSTPSSVLRLTPGSLTAQDKSIGILAPGASSTVTYTFAAPINTTDTTMTLTAVSDPGNLIAEVDETNNTASKTISIGAGLLDLDILALSTDQATYDAGDTVTVTATVKNIGLVSAPSSILRLTPGSLSVQNKTVNILAPGASSTVTYTFIAPINITDSTMTLTVTADPGNLVAEEDETNNTATNTITIKAGLPDLDITALTTDQSSYDAGDTVTVTATVKNIGLVAAPSHILRLTPGSLAVQDKTMGALAVGASVTVTYTFTTPINTTDSTMTLTVKADPGNLIVESDETNNTASKIISIGAGLPDLDITVLSTDKTSYEAGATVTVTATVKNIGLVSMPSSVLRLTPGSLAVQDKTMSALPVGSSATVTYTFTAPITTMDSTVTLTVKADPVNLVAESDETNNTATKTISIDAGLPDLDIIALSTDKTSYEAGATVTVTATVKNIGLVSVSGSILRLTPGSLAVQDKNVGTLAVGASATVTYTFTAPINVMSSTMTLTVAADPTNLIAESDETNNTATMTVSIGAGLPDLTVTTLTTDKTSYAAGATVTVTATVKNIGLVSAPSHVLRLTPGSLTVQDKTVGALAVGASATVTYIFTAPVNAADTTMTLTVAADPANLIAEQNETNNSATTFITIRAALPDLDILSLTTNKTTYDAGETVTVTVTEKNVGLISAPSHTLRLAPGSLVVQDKNVSALAVNATATILYSFTTPIKSTASTMTLTATADPANAVTESDETNNTASTTINVNAGLPDLTVTALSTDKATYDAGETVTVTSTIANQGLVSVNNPVIRLTPGSLPLQDKTATSIVAGASATVSWTFAAPSNLSSSSLLLTVMADPLNAITENDETNNSRSMSIGVNAIKPDITVIDANTTDWYSGKDVVVSATVKNLTAQPVPSVKIQLKAGSILLDEMICVPGYGSNLAVFRFTVPNPPVPPGTMLLTVTISADPDNAIDESNESNNTWTKTQNVSCVPSSIVVDPDSQVLEQDNLSRNGVTPSVPQFTPSLYHSWQEVRLVNGSYIIKTFWAQLVTVFSITPDPRIAYSDSPDLMESGFGVQATCKTTLKTNYDHPEKLIGPQIVWVYTPESSYGQGQKQNVRDSLVTSSGSAGDKIVEWQLAVNPYSAIASRLHYSPLWFPDGLYTALVQAFYAWSPAGQIVDYRTGSVKIQGDMYDRITAVRR